jgi:hypothetical protein
MKIFFNYIFLFIFFSCSVFAQSNSIPSESEDSEETLIEQALALAAEQYPIANQIPITSSIFGVTHPLFIGVDDVTIPTYFGNPATNEWIQAFIGFQVWGAAYDNINDKIYFNNGGTLYEWPVGGSVTLLGTITDPGGATQSMVSLAFYNGVLYGTKNIANEAIYAINTTTYIATVVIDYVDGDFDLGGLAVDPTNGEFYATNDDATPFGNGLFRINIDGTGTQIVAYPTGETDIDGLAMSDTRIAYLVIDQPGNIYVYDLVSGTFLAPLSSPWPTSEVFSGGTWNSGIVPVELTSFKASVIGSDVKLLWETATELNNSGFSIERKSVDSEFTAVGYVTGFGTTTESKSYSFTDNNVRNGIHFYRLKQIDFDGTFEYSSEVEVEVIAPAEFSLDQNYPNPFNPSTKITFSLAIDSKVNLKVFDVLGQEVTTLINQDLSAGVHNFDFDASSINSGVYFYRIEAIGVNGTDEFMDVKKMILVK